MNFGHVIPAIAKYAPLLGSVLAGPGGNAIGQIIASQFGVDPSEEGAEGKLVEAMAFDPNVQVKLLEIQSNNKVELEKLKINQAIAQINADVENTKSARIMNSTNQNSKQKWVDEFIKILIVAGVAATMLYCLYLINTSDVNAEESDILKIITGAVITLFGTIVTFYYGAAFKNSNQDNRG